MSLRCQSPRQCLLWGGSLHMAVAADPWAESRAPTGKSSSALSAGRRAPEVPEQGRGGTPAARAPCVLHLSASAGGSSAARPPHVQLAVPVLGSRPRPSPEPSCRSGLLTAAPHCHSRSRPRSPPRSSLPLHLTATAGPDPRSPPRSSSPPLMQPAMPPHGDAGWPTPPSPAAFTLLPLLLASTSHSAPSVLQPPAWRPPRSQGSRLPRQSCQRRGCRLSGLSHTPPTAGAEKANRPAELSLTDYPGRGNYRLRGWPSWQALDGATLHSPVPHCGQALSPPLTPSHAEAWARDAGDWEGGLCMWVMPGHVPSLSPHSSEASVRCEADLGWGGAPRAGLRWAGRSRTILGAA